MNSEDAKKILEYYNLPGRSPSNATFIFKGQVSGRRPAPAIGGFSSRGPSKSNGGILKPDVIAPGYEILGASLHKDGPFNNYFKYYKPKKFLFSHMAFWVSLITNH